MARHRALRSAGTRPAREDIVDADQQVLIEGDLVRVEGRSVLVLLSH